MRERHPSPFLRKKGSSKPGFENPEDFEVICSREKIHRIRCRRNYHAQVVNVVSPSEIWVRPINHIANKLVISTESPTMLATDLKEGEYVMTPIDNETLVRARIIEYLSNEKRALVKFIDHGDIAWRDLNCLFETKSKRQIVTDLQDKIGEYIITHPENEGGDSTNSNLVKAQIIMPKENGAFVSFSDEGEVNLIWRNENDIYELYPKRDELRCFPWQTIPIKLQGVKPSNNKNWTLEEVNTLKKTLQEYPYIYVLPTIHDRFVINDDSLHTPASLHGLEKFDLKDFKGDMKPAENLGESIAILYHLNLDNPTVNYELDDSFATYIHKEYPCHNDLKNCYPEKYQAFNIISSNNLEMNQKQEIKNIAAAFFDYDKIKDDEIEGENEPLEEEEEANNETEDGGESESPSGETKEENEENN